MNYSKYKKTFTAAGLFSLLVVMTACSSTPRLVYVPLPSKEEQVEGKAQRELSSNKPELTKTPTAITEPTDFPIPNLTATASTTPSATQTQTREPSPSTTPIPPYLIVNKDTACFAGASFDQIVSGYVLQGSEFPILGRITDVSWWMIDDGDSTACWVYGEYVSVGGAIESLPLITSPPMPTLTATVQPSTAGVYYILISENTGGPFGCGDSLIKYYPGAWAKGDMEEDILTALNALFSNHNQYVNGLLNPMYKSELKAKGVDVVGSDVVVQLAGKLVRPKNDCESKRMHDQVWYTVAQFSPTRAVIKLGNALLGDLLVVAK